MAEYASVFSAPAMKEPRVWGSWVPVDAARCCGRPGLVPAEEEDVTGAPGFIPGRVSRSGVDASDICERGTLAVVVALLPRPEPDTADERSREDAEVPASA